MAILYVSSSHTENLATATTIANRLSNTTAGNLIVVAVTHDISTSQKTTSVKDELNASAVLIISGGLVTGQQETSLWYFKNYAGGTRSFTASFSATAQARGITVVEYSGADTTSPLFASGSRTGTAASWDAGTLSATTTTSGTLFVGEGVSTSNQVTGSAPFTTRVQDLTNFVLYEDFIQTTPASVSPGFVQPPSSEFGAVAAAFLPVPPIVYPPPLKLNSGIGGMVINRDASNAGASATVNVTVSPTGVQATGAVGTVTVLAGNYPRTISADSRWVLNGDGTVFNMNGDAGWSVATNLTGSDATNYFADRKAKGVNLVLMQLIEHKFTDQTPKWRNKDGNDPFTGTVSAGNPDFTTPNEVYWTHIDFIFSEAAKYGITLLAMPAYVGFDDGGTQSEGWATVIAANGASNMTTYGTFLGNRYKSTPNVIWGMGGDSSPVCTAGNLTTHINNLANAIKAVDNVHLMTAHPAPGHQSVTDYNQSWLDINVAYPSTNTDLTTRVKAAYQNSPTKPTFMIEGSYGNEHSMTDVLLRTEMYQSVIGGGIGHIYGQSPTWYFGVDASASGNSFADIGGLDWHAQLNTFGANYLRNVSALQASRPFSTLTPDYAHTVVTSGYGTIGTVLYAPVAATNRMLVAYTSGSALTVDKSQFVSATFNVRWYNPRTATTTTSGTAAFGSSTQVFTPPDANDWVLLLDDQALALPAPSTPSATVVVTGVQATGAVGTVAVRADANEAASGVQATAAVGTAVTMAGARPDAITGVQATSAVGSVTLVANANENPTGTQGTGAVGNPALRADANLSVTGVEADGAVGTVTTLAGARPDALTGVQATSAVGSVTLVANANETSTGVQATGAIGSPSLQANAKAFADKQVYQFPTNLENAVWNKSSLTVTPDATTDPNGFLTADRLTPTGVSLSYINQVATGTVGQTFTKEVFAKKDVSDKVHFEWGAANWNPTGTITFDLTNGTKTGTNAADSIVDVGNGWYQIKSTRTSTQTGTLANYATYVDVYGVGAAGNSIYLWNLKLFAATLTGVEADGAVGTVTVTVSNASSVTVNATGVEADCAVGTVSVRADANEAATGVSCASATGTSSVVGKANATSTGVQATGAVGNALVSTSHIVPVTGVQATAAVGTVVVGIGIIALPTGVQINGATGAVVVMGGARPSFVGVQGFANIGQVIVVAIQKREPFYPGEYTKEVIRRVKSYVRHR